MATTATASPDDTAHPTPADVSPEELGALHRDEAERLGRRSVATLGIQLGTLLELVREARANLPAIGDPVLALEAPPSVLENLALALELAVDELPAIVEALKEASKISPEMLQAHHDRTAEALAAIME